MNCRKSEIDSLPAWSSSLLRIYNIINYSPFAVQLWCQNHFLPQGTLVALASLWTQTYWHEAQGLSVIEHFLIRPVPQPVLAAGADGETSEPDVLHWRVMPWEVELVGNDNGLLLTHTSSQRKFVLKTSELRTNVQGQSCHQSSCSSCHDHVIIMSIASMRIHGWRHPWARNPFFSR